MSHAEEQRLRDLERTLFGATLPITEKESTKMDPINAPVPSPTGTPVLSTKFVPWMVGIVGLAGVALTVLPEHTIGYKIALGVVALGSLLGIASPGMRKV